MLLCCHPLCSQSCGTVTGLLNFIGVNRLPESTAQRVWEKVPKNRDHKHNNNNNNSLLSLRARMEVKVSVVMLIFDLILEFFVQRFKNIYSF